MFHIFPIKKTIITNHFFPWFGHRNLGRCWLLGTSAAWLRLGVHRTGIAGRFGGISGIWPAKSSILPMVWSLNDGFFCQRWLVLLPNIDRDYTSKWLIESSKIRNWSSKKRPDVRWCWMSFTVDPILSCPQAPCCVLSLQHPSLPSSKDRSCLCSAGYVFFKVICWKKKTFPPQKPWEVPAVCIYKESPQFPAKIMAKAFGLEFARPLHTFWHLGSQKFDP